MPPALGHRRLWRHAQLTASEVQTVLAGTAAMKATTPKRRQALRGRHVALLCGAPCADALDFSRAVQDAGGRVALLHTGDWQPGDANLAVTARLLGSLYDAVDCCDLSEQAILEIEHHAQRPVFDGLAHPDHPLRLLAAAATALEWQQSRAGAAARHVPRIALSGANLLAAPAMAAVRWQTNPSGVSQENTVSIGAGMAGAEMTPTLDVDFVLDQPADHAPLRLTAVDATPLDQASLADLLAENQRALVQAALASVLS